VVSPLWMYVAVFCIALAAVLLFFLAWRRRELRRKRALEVLRKIAPWELAYLPDILEAYATGNYFGRDSVTRKIHELIDDIQAGGLDDILVRLGWKMVDAFIKNPDTLKKLQDKLAGKPEVVMTPPAPTLATK